MMASCRQFADLSISENSQSITPAVTGYLHRVVAQRPHGPGVARFGEDQIRPGGVRAEVDVCFATKATWLLRSSDTTRWAKSRNCRGRQAA